MFTKANLISTVAVFLVSFFGGYLYYEVLAASFYEGHTSAAATAVMRTEPMPAFIALGVLIQAFVMSTIYSKWAQGSHNARNGFTYGAWIGVLIGFGVWVLNYGVMDMMDVTALVADGIWNIVFYGIMGVVIATVYGKFSST